MKPLCHRALTTQASGVCFTEDGNIVLVLADGETWQLVGGHPEEGETIEAALVREVAEEACATVTALSYLGAQEVNDPHSPSGLTTYYQARYWARITLDKFRNTHEITARKCLNPSEVKTMLAWDTPRILEVILQTALTCEREFGNNQTVL
jgi:NADH pyrophosphatase NudC (nudix superfamily)